MASDGAALLVTLNDYFQAVRAEVDASNEYAIAVQNQAAAVKKHKEAVAASAAAEQEAKAAAAAAIANQYQTLESNQVQTNAKPFFIKTFKPMSHLVQTISRMPKQQNI